MSGVDAASAATAKLCPPMVEVPTPLIDDAIAVLDNVLRFVIGELAVAAGSVSYNGQRTGGDDVARVRRGHKILTASDEYQPQRFENLTPGVPWTERSAVAEAADAELSVDDALFEAAALAADRDHGVGVEGGAS